MLCLVGQLLLELFLLGDIAGGTADHDHSTFIVQVRASIETDITALALLIQVYGFVLEQVAAAQDLLKGGGITLVAGGIANGLHSGFTYVSFDYVQVYLQRPDPLPSVSPAGLAAGAALMVLAVGYALRRRF